MSAPPRQYRPLPGRGTLGFGQLWLAEDHLLEANWMIFAERYRRFPLADIRALVIEATGTRTIWSIVNGTLALLGWAGVASIWWAAGSTTERFAVVGFWILGVVVGSVALVFLIAFLVNLLLGPSCRCLIQTGAGLSALSAPARRPSAERLLRELAPRIEAAQAALAPAP